MIATWRMAVEGITKGAEMLKDGGDAGDAIESAIREVEDFPYYKSVATAGFPMRRWRWRWMPPLWTAIPWI